MLVSGQAPVSGDPIGQRLSDSGSKQLDQSPRRHLLGQSSLQQLPAGSLAQLTRRSSSPLPHQHTTVITTTGPTAAAPASPASRGSVSPPRVSQQGEAAWTRHTPSPAAETAICQGVSATPTAADMPGSTAATGCAVAPAAAPAAAAAAATTIKVPDAAVPAAADLPQHLAGKRKILEGTNSTELIHDQHVKNPAHIYDKVHNQQQQQQQQTPPVQDDLGQQDQQQQQQQQAVVLMQQQQQQLQQQASEMEEPTPFTKQDNPLSQQQQQQGDALSAAATASGAQQSSGSGDMLPPSLVDMARRVLGNRPAVFAPADAAAAAGQPAATSSHDASMAATSMEIQEAQPAAAAGLEHHQLYSEPSLVNMASGPLCSEPSLSLNMTPSAGPSGLPRVLSGAASLEGWLGPVVRTTSGSPRSMVTDRGGDSSSSMRGHHPNPNHLVRVGSSSMLSSSGTGGSSMPRTGSLVFGQPGQVGGHGATLDKQASFGGWPEAHQAAAAAAAGGGFSWPTVGSPMRTISEDNLKLDIQMMPAVVPEEYPPEPPPGSAAAEHDGHLQAMHAREQREQQRREQLQLQQQQQQQQQQLQQQQQHVDRAFFAKVAGWEDELVDMLESQAAPVAIRNIVTVFKDRIHTERDKSEFKALCDKWTGVVEYPAGSGIKCLAIKSWMRGTRTAHHDDSDGSWDD